ncbi:hypothetical protein [Tunturibacter empetritectus]|uniref:Uncharacterized protein n=1 Tax=Tunturiibacter empetritectus TaxID=3069691 RepID=A0A7W8IFX0_9BACT|nr:hypothetical protein [Edaphobacter lichenicola]MBB5316464.1 hypothetical protein [Edaphobacter lichenicola]
MRKGSILLVCGFVFSSFVSSLVSSVAQSSVRLDSSAFDRYTGCRFSDELAVVETSPLAPGIHERTVETLKGPRQVGMVEGRRVMFAYPGKDFYANVKVEILPEKDYAETRQTLVDNFDYFLASSKDSTRNYGLKPKLNGLDIRGLDRDKLEGGVLGIYLLLNDATRMVTTIYFLNQEPKDRSFQTIEDYRMMRDRFLSTYTACVGAK